MQVDGAEHWQIGGPYGGLYYSCVIGGWSPGTHSYKISATDAKGVSATFDGTFLVVTQVAPSSAAASAAALQRAGLLAAVMQERDNWSGYGDSASDDLIDAMLPSREGGPRRDAYLCLNLPAEAAVAN